MIVFQIHPLQSHYPVCLQVVAPIDLPKSSRTKQLKCLELFECYWPPSQAIITIFLFLDQLHTVFVNGHFRLDMLLLALQLNQCLRIHVEVPFGDIRFDWHFSGALHCDDFFCFFLLPVTVKPSLLFIESPPWFTLTLSPHQRSCRHHSKCLVCHLEFFSLFELFQQSSACFMPRQVLTASWTISSHKPSCQLH